MRQHRACFLLWPEGERQLNADLLHPQWLATYSQFQNQDAPPLFSYAQDTPNLLIEHIFC